MQLPLQLLGPPLGEILQLAYLALEALVGSQVCIGLLHSHKRILIELFPLPLYLRLHVAVKLVDKPCHPLRGKGGIEKLRESPAEPVLPALVLQHGGEQLC